MINFRDFITYCSGKWKKVFFVFGNHEFYINRSIEHLKSQYKEFFDTFTNVFLLDSEYIIVDNIAIYGWTKPIHSITSEALSSGLNDYKHICTKKGKLTPKYVNEMVTNERTKFKKFIDDVNSDEIECDAVMVITHFPSIKDGTSDPIYITSDNHLNSYFSWEKYIETNDIRCEKLRVLVSGHTHWCYDFQKTFSEDMKVRFVGNQVGYTFEHTDFTNCSISLVFP